MPGCRTFAARFVVGPRPRLGVCAFLVVSAWASLACMQAADPTPRALVDQYCVTCHNEKLKTAGLLLDKADPANVSLDPETWEKVVRKLRAGAMPPLGMPRPDHATMEHFVATLETFARSRGRREAESRADSGASAESRRVRQRHPRSADHRCRRHRAVAGRRRKLRLRQHRRDAAHVAGAAGALSCRRRARSAGSRSATPTLFRPTKPIACGRILDRTSTSKACRWGRAAAC